MWLDLSEEIAETFSSLSDSSFSSPRVVEALEAWAIRRREKEAARRRVRVERDRFASKVVRREARAKSSKCVAARALVSLAQPTEPGRCARCGGVWELRPGLKLPIHLGVCRAKLGS